MAAVSFFADSSATKEPLHWVTASVSILSVFVDGAPLDVTESLRNGWNAADGEGLLLTERISRSIVMSAA